MLSLDNVLVWLPVCYMKLLQDWKVLCPCRHTKVLEGITDFNELRQYDERFAAIVKGMNIDNNNNMRIACLQLTNAIISTPDDLDFRIHLRNEFWRAGLVDLVEVSIATAHVVLWGLSVAQFQNKCAQFHVIWSIILNWTYLWPKKSILLCLWSNIHL